MKPPKEYNEEQLGVIKSSLRYDSRTGMLIWKIKPRKASFIGDTAGCLSPLGYIHISFRGMQLKAHRVAWFLFYGRYPKNIIDHINGNRADNRIENLREVTHRENLRNMKKHRNGMPPGITISKIERMVLSIERDMVK